MYLRLLVVALVFLSSISSAQAATLYMSPTTVVLEKTDATTLSVRLDVDEDECVNAVDAVISFPPEVVPIDISRGRSILSIWIEEPVINQAERTISFAGGIPNGYCGRIIGDPQLTNNILDIVVQSPGFVISSTGATRATSTDVALTFGEETQVLLNDNFGTQAELMTVGATITLLSKVGQGRNDWLDVVAADEAPPNSFLITLNRTPNAFSNDYFITFNTTDKQSGIDHYEVLEESFDDLPFFNFRWARVDAPWTEVTSPYVLKDQSLNSVIRVRAIDKAGNEYVASLTPDEEIRTMSQSAKILIVLIAGALGLFVMIGFVVLWWVLRRRSRSRNHEKLHIADDQNSTNDSDGGKDVTDDEN